MLFMVLNCIREGTLRETKKKIMVTAGWLQLLDGNITQASYTAYHAAWGSMLMPVLFFVLSGALYFRTKNWAILFIVQIAFLSVFYTYFDNAYGLAASVSFLTVSVTMWLYESFRKT